VTIAETQGPGAPALADFPRQPLHQRRSLAVDLRGAAELLGCSDKWLKREVLPELRVVVRGEGKRRRYLIAVSELERWLRESSRLLFEEELPRT
jgi:hypothetical protein